jgi:uncharacterized protein (DUF433 family)
MADGVATDPRVLAGIPVIREIRIPVHLMMERMAAGNSREAILGEYSELTDEDVTSAVEYASQLREAGGRVTSVDSETKTSPDGGRRP